MQLGSTIGKHLYYAQEQALAMKQRASILFV
jgi:hypothetical protein